MNPKTLRRLSASRIISINECSMKFYLKEYMNIPEKIWPRTIIGSVCHSVLEALRRAKHRKHYDTIFAAETIYASPAITRLVKIWQDKHKIAQELIDDVDPMVMLVIQKTNFMDVEADEVFDPEHEFILVLPSGGKVKGFIDRMARYGDVIRVTDYKSQKEKFPKKKVVNSFQGLTYQLYIFRKFGLLAWIEFVLMRHPPTKRTPEMHLQIMKPSTPEQLAGFEMYLDHLHASIQNFGWTEACSNYHKDSGFCKNVCSYYRPMEYLALKKKETNELVGTFMIDNPPQVPDDCYVETLYSKGCPKWNPQ